MSKPMQIQLIGAPLACAAGVQDTWRAMTTWVGQQLQSRFGDAEQVVY